MGFLYEGLNVQSFLALVAFIAAFLFLNEISRRSIKVSMLMYVLLPVLLAIGICFGPLGSPTGKTWFGWVKPKFPGIL